jgi:hypothetical protein
MGFRKSVFTCFIMFVTLSLPGQDPGNVGDAILFDSEFISDQYQRVYSQSPSVLSAWNFGSWSNIGFSYDYAKGDFRNLQQFNKRSLFNFQTESVHSLEGTGWTFYGLFNYANGRVDSIGGNLSYSLPKNGSPYYLIIQRIGMWKLQNYEFNVVAANQLTEKLSMGVRILYDGDLNFRYNDTRNNQTTLHTDLAFSAAYKLNNSIISAGAEYKRRKTEPTLTNKYPTDSQGLEYNVYINAGLGTYLRRRDFNMTFMGFAYSGIAQWILDAGNDRYSLSYKGSLGEEHMINKNIRAEDEENKVLRYDYSTHLISLNGLNNLGSTYFSTDISFSMTAGEGNQWNETSLNYLTNFTSDIMQLQLHTSWHRPTALLGKAGLFLTWHSEKRFDRNFGYTFSFTNVTAGPDFVLNLPLGNKKISAGAGAYYNMNLDHTNNPGAAATNLYNAWIAEPLMSFLSADYLLLPLHLEYQMPFGKNLLSVRVKAEYSMPMAINYTQNPRFTTNDNFLYINSSIKFYF